MSETKYTPGEWKFDADWSLIVGPNGEEVAAIHPAQSKDEARCNRQTAKANARLIAAAPELLEALQMTLATLERAYKPTGQFSSIQGTLDVASAAIAKATA